MGSEAPYRVFALRTHIENVYICHPQGYRGALLASVAITVSKGLQMIMTDDNRVTKQSFSKTIWQSCWSGMKKRFTL
jgi:hypothetical protein